MELELFTKELNENEIQLYNDDQPAILVNQEAGDAMRHEQEPKTEEAKSARKLILAIAAVLVCWLPYFIWLPTSTILVGSKRWYYVLCYVWCEFM